MPAPDLYAWRRVLPKKKGSSAGTTMSMDEIRALQGLPGVNVD